jgi:GAF domain-containing protein
MSGTGSTRAVGVGRVLIVVYAILALGATARSIVQIVTKFDQAPVAYLLSAVAGVVYLLATIALIGVGTVWYRVAWATISFELLGVLVVGTLSLTQPELFRHPSVWSHYGQGYLFVPLVLPVLGMLWLHARRPSRQFTATDAA